MSNGQRVIQFIEQYCRVPEGALVGQPLHLLDFQKDFIRDIYDNPHGTRNAYLSIARKQGKSSLTACLLLAHLIGPQAIQNSQIISGAMSRDQAGLVFNAARKIIAQSETLSQLIQVKQSLKTLYAPSVNVEYRAIAAEGSTAMGLSPVLAILDEVGQIETETSEFVEAITSSQGAYEQPLLIAISTQAATDRAMFSQWLDDAENNPTLHTVSHAYSADANCALDDETQWAKANPAMGLFRSRADIAQQAAKAKRIPATANSFRNLILNQRIDQTTAFVAKDTWQLNGQPPLPLDPDIPCVAGLDLSRRNDLTSLVIVQKINNDYNVHTYAWLPEQGLLEKSRQDRTPFNIWRDQGYLRTTDSKTISYNFIAQEIARDFSNLTFSAVFFDRWKIEDFKEALERYNVDLPLIEHGQGYRDVSPSLDNLEAELLEGRIRHGENPLLTYCTFNAKVATDPANSRKLDKAKSRGHIDCLMALVMAFHRIEPDQQPTKPKDISGFINDPLMI